jgi:hydrogenase nickel incorporation protein HypA/HybF
MHELSIAQNIVEIVSAEAAKIRSGKVLEVCVEIGVISGVDPESLKFVWDMSVKDTLVEGAVLKIQMIEPKAICLDCKQEFKVGVDFDCPSCHSSNYEILSGRELKIRAITIEEDQVDEKTTE